jgi:hypothetical protein
MRYLSASVLLLTATFACAQHPIASPADCPVNLFAQRQSGTVVLAAKNAPRQDGPSQGLHVTLKPLATTGIESVVVTLHAVSPDPRVIPAGTTSPNISKTFELHRNAGEETLDDFDVSMHHVGALRWIDITAITYTDGTTWHAPQASTCRAIPNSLVLIGDR